MGAAVEHNECVTATLACPTLRYMSSPTRNPKSSVPAASGRNKTARAAEDPRALVTPEVREILDHFHLGNVLSHLLRRAHFIAEEVFAGEFAAESITPRQKAILVILYQCPGLSQNALADRLFMDRNTVADMVRRLVSAGLIRRAHAKDDQRAYELFLADAGAQMLNAVMPRDIEVERRLAERLPPEYLPLFVKCLRLLIDPSAEK
jgi:DNA-binding MarR family transcriptional regulator